jgi:hypothetical protein
MIFELLLINFGTALSTYCICNYVLKNVSPQYTGVSDLVKRLGLAAGLIVNSLLIPIWLQQSRFPEESPLLFVVGASTGMLLAGFLRKN